MDATDRQRGGRGGEEEEERRRRRGGGEGEETDIKSNKPHLTGGEKQCDTPKQCVRQVT